MTAAPLVGVIRVVVTGDDTKPTAEQWEAGELVEDTVAAIALAKRLADEQLRDDRYAFVWIGHNGVYVPGLWKWWIRIPPPGWKDVETERQERDLAAWYARKAADAIAAKEAKTAAATVRKAEMAGYKPKAADATDVIR